MEVNQKFSWYPEISCGFFEYPEISGDFCWKSEGSQIEVRKSRTSFDAVSDPSDRKYCLMNFSLYLKLIKKNHTKV